MVYLVTETTPTFHAITSSHRFFVPTPVEVPISDKKNIAILKQVMIRKGFPITEVLSRDSLLVRFYSDSHTYESSGGTLYMPMGNMTYAVPVTQSSFNHQISIHMYRLREDGKQGVQGLEEVWYGYIDVKAEDFDKTPDFFISHILDNFGREDRKISEEWFPSSGEVGTSSDGHNESRQESTIVAEMKLEDISVTVSSNTLKLRNFKVLVGPILSTADNGKSDLLTSEIIAVESGFMKAGFTIVDRKLTKDILSEMYLQQTGIVSARDAARLGEISGAGIIITGSIDMFGVVDRMSDAEVKISVSLKAISIESSEILAVAHYYGGLKKGFLRAIAQRLGNELLKFGGPVNETGRLRSVE